MSYVTRPSNKLHCRWVGLVEVVARLKNNITVRDLTNDAHHEYDVSRLKPFIVAPGVEVKDVAAVEVSKILYQNDSVKKRAEMEFMILWSDEDETWEPWERVKKMAELDAYILSHPEANVINYLNENR